MSRAYFRKLGTLALVAILLIPGSLLAQSGKKIALVVGINKYHHSGLQKLEFAENDVLELKEVLETAGYEVKALVGEEATLDTIRKQLDTMRKKPGADGVFVVALAGHGIQPEGSNDAYYCPFDADQRVLAKDDPNKDPWDYKTLLPLTEVVSNLKAASAGSRMLLVDACRNDPTSGRGRGVGTGLQVGDLPDNTAVLLSCSKGQRAYESKSWKIGEGKGHGAFFYQVLVGIRESKAVDKKGRFTADALWDHVKETVPEEVSTVIMGGAEQKPFRLITGEVDLRMRVEKKEPVPGEERIFDVGKGVKMKFCWIPGSKGKAKLGSPKKENKRYLDEREHEVVLDGFWMAKYTVTQSEYVKLTGEKNPSYFSAAGGGKANVPANTDDYPVETVSWDDAQECIKEMKAPQGMKRVGLPSEAQWEWAARGGRGNDRAFYWGDVLNGDKANCDGRFPYGTETKGECLECTTKVGSYEGKAAHPWGLCDMSGNVYQWCEDYYGDYGELPGGKDPVQTVKQSNDLRVLRGGSWFDVPVVCRSAYRNNFSRDVRKNSVGFRVVVLQ